MYVNLTVREQALLRILQQRLGDAGTEIALTELEQEWRGTGLRAGDLHDGVREFERRGVWAASDSFDGALYRLLPGALERLLATPATVDELAARVIARANLFRAARRRRSARPGHGRRAADGPAAP